MVAAELRDVHAADNVPFVVLEVHVVECAVVVLRKSFLSHEVGSRDGVALRVGCRKSEFLEFVLGTELEVITVAVGVVECGVMAPVFVWHPRA